MAAEWKDEGNGIKRPTGPRHEATRVFRTAEYLDASDAERARIRAEHGLEASEVFYRPEDWPETENRERWAVVSQPLAGVEPELDLFDNWGDARAFIRSAETVWGEPTLYKRDGHKFVMFDRNEA
jgi:hypothetical protein